jgi:hypothetical protein
MPKKSYNEKLNNNNDLPKIVTLTDAKAIAMYKGTIMYIAEPMAYSNIMKKVPLGKVLPIDYIKRYLAKKHNANFTCPLTAGIFVNIAANAAVERNDSDFPYWRTLKKDGELNEKFPLGVMEQKQLLELEGHTIIQKGKKFFVKDFEQKIFDLK